MTTAMTICARFTDGLIRAPLFFRFFFFFFFFWKNWSSIADIAFSFSKFPLSFLSSLSAHGFGWVLLFAFFDGSDLCFVNFYHAFFFRGQIVSFRFLFLFRFIFLFSSETGSFLLGRFFSPPRPGAMIPPATFFSFQIGTGCFLSSSSVI
ncbi:hypothetical protein BZA05DRAFT_27564 [Tricharina praecox]|uniref:uncharacterized protein n=1 Tax=Tricharina praecox TaxID=43433 RepID=UPI00221EF874|nr:uncharacterized protein BZA05DRAFT_27564 [Tricharina praecox]KAI5853390.1 hypothetical protein BZA05DRAFT_27564 [Tricharina praecox]